VSRIPDEIVEQVRDSADLIELVSESVELKRTGTDYRGPCPFHGGTHRNFAVIPKKGIFYCYVCHEGGDVFTYLMKRFGMDYPTAVREVARRVGITVPESTERSGPDPREPLFSAVAVAQDWFAAQLRESPDAGVARSYLQERHWDLSAAIPLGLGYAPKGNALLEHAKALGIEDEVLVEAGLVVRRDDGSTYPRFRGRLTFPINDGRGRVVGFGGRLIGPGEPKYLNSPESPIYHKGRLLYNLHHAKQAIRQHEHVLLVEGYFDVLRLMQVGIDHVVAPLGTALTPDQAELLKRYTTRVVVLYDSDQAGLRATFRAADELLRHEFEVRVGTLPGGEDPDTLAQSGGRAAIEQVVDDAIDVLERKIQILQRKGWFEGIEQRRRALDRLMPTVRATSSSITRELYLTRLSELTGVAKAVLSQDASQGPMRRPLARRTRESGLRRHGEREERNLLAIMLHSPVWLERAGELVRPEWIEGEDYRDLFQALTGPDGADYLTIPPPDVPDEARATWSRLKESGADLEAQNVDTMFAHACQALESRPFFRELDALADRLQQAPTSEQEALLEERQRRTRELQARFPAEWKRRYMQRKFAQGGPRGR
jgi:DNA primase